MAEGVGLSAQAPDMGKTLTNINSFLDLYKKTKTIQPETEAAVAEAKAKTAKSTAEKNQLRRNFMNSLAENEDVVALSQDPNNSVLQKRVQKAIFDTADQAIDALGEDSKPAVMRHIGQLSQLAQQRPQDFAGFMKSSVSANALPSERYAAQIRQPIQIGQGAGTALLSAQPGNMGQQVGYAPNALGPQVFANQITGAPQILGGGNAPQVQNYNQGPVPQGNVSVQAAGGQPIVNLGGGGTASAARGAQILPQNQGKPAQQDIESAENFNKRIAFTQGAYLKAQDQYTNINSEYGHIPTIKNINQSILGLLKDPSVNTGAIQSYLAGNTKYANLTPKEQELNKLLEQRVQNLSPKSDADAASKKAAYGSLALKKEALIELVRRDQTWATTQDLQAKGTLHNGGNAVNPNYGRVANFNSQFSQYAADPNLMRYISVVGEDPSKIRIDKHDKDLLDREMGKISIEQRKALEQKRQDLIKLVNGQQ